MADMTDGPFTKICREIAGKDFVIFREMVSAEAIVRGNAKTLKMCEFSQNRTAGYNSAFWRASGVPLWKRLKLWLKNLSQMALILTWAVRCQKLPARRAGAALLKDIPPRGEYY